jgi:curved DNA-binding protein CbpA
MEIDYYKTLELPRDATERDIKRAYHRLARERHPDKGTTPEQIRRLQEEFALISTAYNVLKDKEKRAEHDARLRKDLARRANESGATAGRQEPSATGTAARAKSTSSRERASIAQRAYAKGLQFYTAGDFVRAIDFFEAAVQNNDDEAAYHSKLGVSLMRSRTSFSRAVTAIQRAIELDPYNIEHRLALGEAYELVGSQSLAVKTYQEILKWDANNNRALDRLTALGAGPGNTLISKILGFLKRR